MSPGPIGLQDHLGIRRGAETKARTLKPITKLDVVEDFAVEADPTVFIGVAHRLGAAFEINDRKPGVAESDSAFHMNAAGVRTAVADCGDHAFDDLARGHATI